MAAGQAGAGQAGTGSQPGSGNEADEAARREAAEEQRRTIMSQILDPEARERCKQDKSIQAKSIEDKGDGLQAD